MFGAYVVWVWANENGVNRGVVLGEGSCMRRPCPRCVDRKARIAAAVTKALKEMGR